MKRSRTAERDSSWPALPPGALLVHLIPLGCPKNLVDAERMPGY